MDIKVRQIGTSAGHALQPPTPVHEWALHNGDLRLSVWTYGASLIGLWAPDARGRSGNVVVCHPDLASYEDPTRIAYLGATVGRYARCIANGRFVLDGRTIQLVPTFGPHHFHGGKVGFDRFVWAAEAWEDGEAVVLRLALSRPDGDQGYPGDIHVQTDYRLLPDRLQMIHRAQCSAPTLAEITNHAMWNLDGGGRIDGHRLCIPAGHVIEVDDDLIPIGAPVPVDGTLLDFRHPRLLGSQRLDHCFALGETPMAADLWSPSSGRGMRIETDQPGLQVYSGDVFEWPRAGICLQTGGWPDAPNQPGYPSAVLRPGQRYEHRTIHTFYTRTGLA